MFKWRAFGLCCVLFGFCATGTSQTPTFFFSAQASSGQIGVGSPLLYTIAITNFSTAADFLVTNTFSGPVTVLAASNTQGSVSINSNVVTFLVTNVQFSFSGVPTNTISVMPTAPGTITNAVTVTGPFETQPTNLITTVTNVVNPVAIIQGGIQPDLGQVFVNDRLHYSISFSNIGTADSSAFVISNFFSTNLLIRSVSPSNVLSSDSTHLLLNADSVAVGAISRFDIIIQPTNSGDLTVSATFGGSSVSTNGTNSSSFMETVLQPDTNQLVAVTNSAQMFDPQTGLMRQTILLSNNGTGTVTSARVIVAGLTNRLYNAVGTNGNDPFVIYSGSLAVGTSVTLVLEYFIPSRTPGPDPTLTAYPIATVDLAAPASVQPTIKQIADLGGGRALIEFESEPGRSYLIVYADNASFTNALRAQPTIIAPANRTQWIDEGPPKTISRLTTNSVRCYRVIGQ